MREGRAASGAAAGAISAEPQAAAAHPTRRGARARDVPGRSRLPAPAATSTRSSAARSLTTLCTSGLTTRRATTTGLSPSVWTTSATPSRSSAGCAGSGAGRGRGRKPRREMKSPAGAGLYSSSKYLSREIPAVLRLFVMTPIVTSSCMGITIGLRQPSLLKMA